MREFAGIPRKWWHCRFHFGPCGWKVGHSEVVGAKAALVALQRDTNEMVTMQAVYVGDARKSSSGVVKWYRGKIDS